MPKPAIPAPKDEIEHAPASTTNTNPILNPMLSAQLDSLLVSYLELLDTYTTLREQLSKDFASGFFSIAQANRSSTLGPGRRYGEENYDERMKALRRFEIIPKSHCGNKDEDTATQEQEQELQKEEHETEDGMNRYRFSISHIHESGTTLQSEKQTAAPLQATTSTPSSSTESNKTTSAPSTSSEPSDAKPTTKTNTKNLLASKQDPLTWFGILTPPALRAAQNTFTKSTTTTIPSLLNTILDMEQLESRIWKVRRALGILNQYYTGDDAMEEETISTGNLPTVHKGRTEHREPAKVRSSTEDKASRTHEKGLISPPASPPHVMKTLASRPATSSQPRSRILKME